MEILFLLIPVSLILILASFWAFIWSVKNDQFDDLDKEAWRILQDNTLQENVLQGDVLRDNVLQDNILQDNVLQGNVLQEKDEKNK